MFTLYYFKRLVVLLRCPKINDIVYDRVKKMLNYLEFSFGSTFGLTMDKLCISAVPKSFGTDILIHTVSTVNILI
jgi:hypothetical protein